MSGEPIKPRGGDAVSAQAGGAVPQAGTSTTEDIAAFVAKARALSPHAPGAKGRLIFALDATMSRQPTWDMACALQADMFRETAALGSLDPLAKPWVAKPVAIKKIAKATSQCPVTAPIAKPMTILATWAPPTATK